VVDLQGCGGESFLGYSHSTQVKLRRDLLLRAVSVIYSSVEVFSYYGLENYVVFNCKFVVYSIPFYGSIFCVPLNLNSPIHTYSVLFTVFVLCFCYCKRWGSHNA